MSLEPGDKAPDFTLVDQHDQPFSLRASIETHGPPHFVYFYPENTRS